MSYFAFPVFSNRF